MVVLFYLRSFLILAVALTLCGCNAYQPTKNVWKTTRGLWHTYVSPPASVDYEEKGSLSPEARALSSAMIGIDKQLGSLERTMQNADKPPTQEWLDKLFAAYPWLSGFAGVKYDGTLLGQEPPNPMKELDFNPLLYEDQKQNSRALRADVQPSPLGPEVMIAAPLYDGIDFLGIVVAYFDMRALTQYASDPQDIVILCPTALLWPGKYDFAATPLAGTDWSKVVVESSAGTCTNSNGTFFYMVRYLGNLPLVFAIPEKGNFPEGNGNLEQGAAFFPQEREKLPPPPAPERKPGLEDSYKSFGAPEEEAPAETERQPEAETPPQPEQPARPARKSGNEIEAGSRESLLLKSGKATQRRRVQERQLEGENIEIERVQRPRRAPSGPSLDLIPDSEQGPTLPGGRPSPFGPREEIRRPSPFGPGAEQSAPETSSETAPTETKAAPREKAPETSAQPEDAKERGGAAETGASGDQKKAAEPADDQERLADGEKAEPAESAPAAMDDSAAEKAKEPQNEGPGLLPGGRPSPFGPRN